VHIKLIFCVVLALIVNEVFAESEGNGTPKTSARLSSMVSPSRFHWITHKCTSEGEEGEIETTPGAPPMNIDDPATPGCNKWEINVVVDGEFTRAQRTWDLPLLDINYGVGDNLQLKYEVPNVVMDSADSHTRSIGNSKFGIKYQFYGNDETKHQFAIYPQIQFLAPVINSGPEEPDSAGRIVTLPVLMAVRVGRVERGPLMMTANVGYNISTKADTANFGSAAVALGAPLVGQTSILAEIVTEQALKHINDDPREQVLKLNVGLMSPVGKHFIIFGSVGRSLATSDGQDHTYVLSGFRLLAGE
jgi:hypothetical protein